MSVRLRYRHNDIINVFIFQPATTLKIPNWIIIQNLTILRTLNESSGTHQILAHNVYAAKNKRKFQILLKSSKTHTIADYRQKVTIISSQIRVDDKYRVSSNRTGHKNREIGHCNPKNRIFLQKIGFFSRK